MNKEIKRYKWVILSLVMVILFSFINYQIEAAGIVFGFIGDEKYRDIGNFMAPMIPRVLLLVSLLGLYRSIRHVRNI